MCSHCSLYNRSINDHFIKKQTKTFWFSQRVVVVVGWLTANGLVVSLELKQDSYETHMLLQTFETHNVCKIIFYNEILIILVQYLTFTVLAYGLASILVLPHR